MKKRKEDYGKYRFEDSKDKLKSAQILFKKGQFKDSLSRSYYAMFSAARSLLVMKELDSSKHSGVISLFNQHFVKTGMVSKEAGKILKEAKELRESSDYEDFYLVSKDDVTKQIENAKRFIDEAGRVLRSIIKSSE